MSVYDLKIYISYFVLFTFNGFFAQFSSIIQGTGPALGVGRPIVLYKTCSVLLYVLEQPRVYNSSAGSFRRDALFGEIDPIGLRPALHPNNSKHRIQNNRETLLHQKR